MNNQKSFLRRHLLIIILSLIALVGAYFYFFAPTTKPPIETVPRPTPVPTTPISSLPPIDSGFQPIGQITWRLESPQIPETLPVIHIGGPLTQPEAYSPLVQALGIDAAPTRIPGQPVYLWNSQNGEAGFYVNLKDKVASYTLNQDIAPLPTSGEKTSPADLTDRLLNLLSPVLILPENFSLIAGETRLLVEDEERYVPAPSTQATFAEVTLNYSFNGYYVTYRGLPSVIARYSLFGPLVSLKISLPFTQISLSQDYTLKTFEEIQATPLDQFEVISLTGNRAFELSDQDEVLRNTTVTALSIGYLTNPTSSAVAPYIFLEGTSQTSRYGTVTVTLVTPALKLVIEE